MHFYIDKTNKLTSHLKLWTHDKIYKVTILLWTSDPSWIFTWNCGLGWRRLLPAHQHIRLLSGSTLGAIDISPHSAGNVHTCAWLEKHTTTLDYIVHTTTVLIYNISKVHTVSHSSVQRTAVLVYNVCHLCTLYGDTNSGIIIYNPKCMTVDVDLSWDVVDITNHKLCKLT